MRERIRGIEGHIPPVCAESPDVSSLHVENVGRRGRVQGEIEEAIDQKASPVHRMVRLDCTEFRIHKVHGVSARQAPRGHWDELGHPREDLRE